MSRNLYDTINYRGMQINVYFDEDCESPAEWGDDEAFLTSDWRSLWLNKTPVTAQDCRDAYETKRNFVRVWNNRANRYDGYFIFPCSVYEHSGITVTGVYKDSDEDFYTVCGHAFICVRQEKGTWTRTKAYERAKSIRQVWAEYLEGETYGVTVEDEEENEIDSCWGYIGEESKEMGIDEAKAVIDNEIEKREREKKIARQQFYDRRKAQIRARVPLIYRTAMAV